MRMRHFSWLAVLLLLLTGWVYVETQLPQRHSATTEVYTVKPTVVTQRLYFKGTLQPKSAVAVLSPADGVCTAVAVTQGQSVKKGMLLAQISAPELQEKLRQKIADFLQKKSDLQEQISKYKGDEALYKAGVLSADTLNRSKKSRQIAALNLDQAQYATLRMLKQLGVAPVLIKNMSLENAGHIGTLLSQAASQLVLRAPAAGVVLRPRATKDKSADSIRIGASVKAGASVFSIADISGYTIPIDVSEMDIVALRVGQPVRVTGPAFGGAALMGKITRVGVEATVAGHDTQAVYPVVVTVPSVDDAVRQHLRLGMTVKVAVTLATQSQIIIPVRAVIRKGSRTWVQRLRASGGVHSVLVKLGQTTPSGVEVISGLSVNDRIVLQPLTELPRD